MRAFKSNQIGGGIVELLIAMIIGLFLLLGLSSAFISMNSSATARKTLSDLHDEQRISMFLLSSFVQEAGYYNYTTGVTNATELPNSVAQGVSLSAGQSLSGSTINGSDTITIRYMTDALFPRGTCNNVSSASTILTYIDTFSVSGNSLICTETNGLLTTTRAIANNVTNISVLYGIDDGNGNGSVDVYTNASNFPATYGWNMVKTVTLTLTYIYKDSLTGLLTNKKFSQTIPVMNSIL